MKKIWGWIVGLVIVVAIGAYIIFSGSGSNSSATQTATNTGGDTTGTGTDTTSTAGNASSGDMGGMVMGQYSDGTYTSPVENAIYGNLQLNITVSGGMITAVAWPVYPNTAGHTIQVNTAALPTLEQETIAAQNANVNIVSGATQTSEAFQQGLAAALAQAKG